MTVPKRGYYLKIPHMGRLLPEEEVALVCAKECTYKCANVRDGARHAREIRQQGQMNHGIYSIADSPTATM